MAERDEETVWEVLARLDVMIATARALADRAGAERVTLLVDQGEAREPALIECSAGGDVVITEGERDLAVPAGQEIAVAPLPIPDVRGLPYAEVDAAAGHVAAPVGAIQALVAALEAVAAALPGRSVVTADWPTNDPETPLTIAAREGEPVVLALGEETFGL